MFKVTAAPRATACELIVTELFASFAFAIEPANMALVIPVAFTLSVSAFVSIELSSTVTEITPLECARPSPATVAASDKVASPEVAPPVRPSPATTPVMSAAFPSIVSVPALSSYVAVMFVPPTINELTLSSTLSSVKYRLPLSVIEPVFSVMFAVPSNETPEIVLALASAVAVPARPVVSWLSVATVKSKVLSPSWYTTERPLSVLEVTMLPTVSAINSVDTARSTAPSPASSYVAVIPVCEPLVAN